MTLSNFIVEEEMEKEKVENNSLSFTNSQLFMGENKFGSPGRVRAIKKNRMFFSSNNVKNGTPFRLLSFTKRLTIRLFFPLSQN